MDCHYCGAPADTKDHIIPVSYLTNSKPSQRQRHSIGETVDCCRECNSLLGAKAVFTVEERAHEIAERLTRRYSKELKAPYWSEEELAELGPTLRDSIVAKQSVRKEVLERIKNATSVASGLLERALPLYPISDIKS